MKAFDHPAVPVLDNGFWSDELDRLNLPNIELIEDILVDLGQQCYQKSHHLIYLTVSRYDSSSGETTYAVTANAGGVRSAHLLSICTFSKDAEYPVKLIACGRSIACHSPGILRDSLYESFKHPDIIAHICNLASDRRRSSKVVTRDE